MFFKEKKQNNQKSKPTKEKESAEEKIWDYSLNYFRKNLSESHKLFFREKNEKI